MSKRPYMPLWIDDYLADTTHLGLEEHGAYLMLIMHYWTKGGLPDDDDQIRRVSHMTEKQWQKSRKTLLNFFAENWRHDRIDAEISKVIEKSKVNSANAKKSHAVRNARASANGSPNAHANAVLLQTPDSIEVVGINPTTSRADGMTNELASDGSILMGLGKPITDWHRGEIPPEQRELMTRFILEKQDHFSHDWPAWWERWRDAELAKAAPKPPRKRAPARVEVNARPEAVPATRSMITPDAYALANEVRVAIGLAPDHPKAYGMPMTVQGWLAAWDAGVILQTVQGVCAGKDFGDDPPGPKYFEKAIARAHADLKRPVPVANPGETTHARNAGSNLAAAADRLSARIGADDGLAVDGRENGDDAVRLLQAR